MHPAPHAAHALILAAHEAPALDSPVLGPARVAQPLRVPQDLLGLHIAHAHAARRLRDVVRADARVLGRAWGDVEVELRRALGEGREVGLEECASCVVSGHRSPQ